MDNGLINKNILITDIFKIDVGPDEANEAFISSIYLLHVTDENDTNDDIAAQPDNMATALFITTKDEDNYQEKEVL